MSSGACAAFRLHPLVKLLGPFWFGGILGSTRLLLKVALTLSLSGLKVTVRGSGMN